MVFAISEGKLQSINKATYQAPSSVRLAPNMTESYEALYSRQGAVRSCVDFLARNVGQLSVHTFRKMEQNDRERVSDHPYAQLMSRPNRTTTGFRLMFSLIADRGIYDRGLWVKTHDNNGLPELTRVPPRMWRVAGSESWLSPKKFEVKGSKGSVMLDIEQVVYFRGYNPLDERQGLSPIESLRRVLAEEWAASQMREQILRNGARASGYIQRPKDAPAWSDHARSRFGIGWRQQYVGHSATDAMGTPILEDGMTFVGASQTAADLQYVESRKLSREEAAAAYFIPPPMVGILDNATFGNIEEQHKMLYQDTLGPILQEVQQELKLQLMPDFDDVEGLYSEFNMLEKLRGSFEEQASQLQTSVGAPFLTRNEARGRLNLPRVEGGDELVVPLNVLVGGQASPTDSGTQNLASGPVAHAKSRSFKSSDVNTDPYLRASEELLSRFFKRQRAVVLSALGSKASTAWWDEDRWNGELTADLFKLAVSTATSIGRGQAEALGFRAGEYDEDRTLAFLQAVAKSRAEAINAATRSQIDDALDADEPDVAHVFEVAESQRKGTGSKALVTALAGFAVMEAGKQLIGSKASKSWLVMSGNPRPEHAAMDGETVPIESHFSNGAKWPGDPMLGADGVAGCSCELEIFY